MKLHPPFIIGPRLLPALRIGDALVSIERDEETRDNRDRFRYYIDLADDSEHSDSDLRSGVGGCTLTEAFRSLLSFLSAAAESFNYQERTGRKGEHVDLFPLAVVEWASMNSDALSMLSIELEESADLIVE